MTQLKRIISLFFCTLFFINGYSQAHKLWSIDITNNRVILDSIKQSKFVPLDTLKFKFDPYSTYTKTYDSKNNHYILECDTALIIFNMNGKVVKTIPKIYDLEGMEYNPLDGYVYCVALKNSSYYFAKINLNNSQLSLLKPLSDNSLNSSTLDYEKGYYYIISDSKGLFKIDMQTGTKLDSTKVFTTNNCSCNEYDNETGKIATICVINAKKTMQLFDPLNKTFTTIDTIAKYGTGYFGYNASTYNQTTGDWYFNLGKNIGVKNCRSNAKMDTLTTGFNRIRSIEYPGQACYNALVAATLLISKPLCHGGNGGEIAIKLQGGRPPYYTAINNGGFDSSVRFKNLSSGVYALKMRDKNDLCKLSLQAIISEPAIYEHTTIQIHNKCFGERNGEIKVSTKGNTAPYTYALDQVNFSSSNHLTNLAEGSYRLYIKDTYGCMDSVLNLNISAPKALDLDSLNQSPISCYNASNGALFAKPKGGVAPYSMALDTKSVLPGGVLRDIAEGRYVFTMLDANGCKYEKPLEWNRPEAILLDAYIENNKCIGEQGALAVLKLKGNKTISNYVLRNTADMQLYNLYDTLKNLSAGKYAFTLVTENGCVDSTNFEIKTSPVLNILKTRDTVLCEGQLTSIDLNTFGGMSYKTVADNGFTFNTATYMLSMAGTYFVVTTDSNACSFYDTFGIRKTNIAVLHDFLLPSMGLLGDTVYAVNMSSPKGDGYSWGSKEQGAMVDSANGMHAKWYFKDTGNYGIWMAGDYGDCHFERHKNIRIVPMQDSMGMERRLGYRGPLIMDFRVYSNPHDGQHFSIEILLRDTAEAKLYKLDGNGGLIVSELDLGKIKGKTLTAFGSIKSEVYYLKLVVGRESRVIKVVAVL